MAGGSGQCKEGDLEAFYEVLDRGGFVVRIILFPLNGPAFLVLLLFRVPVLGRLVGEGVRLLQEVISQIANLGDLLLRCLGRRLQKRLRIHVIILRVGALPVVRTDALQRQIETAQLALAEVGVALRAMTVQEDDRPAPAAALDVGANARAYRDDLGRAGCFFEGTAGRLSFHTSFLRLIGQGSPLFVFVVRSIPGFTIGCSLGAAADYVTLLARAVQAQPGEDGDDPTLLAHELGHALGLLHRRDAKNLLFPWGGRGTALTRWQSAVIRGSRHVTYF